MPKIPESHHSWHPGRFGASGWGIVGSLKAWQKLSCTVQLAKASFTGFPISWTRKRSDHGPCCTCLSFLNLPTSEKKPKGTQWILLSVGHLLHPCAARCLTYLSWSWAPRIKHTYYRTTPNLALSPRTLPYSNILSHLKTMPQQLKNNENDPICLQARRRGVRRLFWWTFENIQQCQANGASNFQPRSLLKYRNINTNGIVHVEKSSWNV